MISEFSRPGAANGRAKLNEDDVRMIRQLVSDLTYREVAVKFDITKQAVGLIVARKRWGHVE